MSIKLLDLEIAMASLSPIVKYSILALMVATSIAHAEPQDFENSARLLFDSRLSAISGATTLPGIRSALVGFEDFVAQKHPVDLSNPLKAVLRLGRIALVQVPLDTLSVLVQHEIFGHATRYREFGKSAAVFIHWPPFPFSLGSSYTKAPDLAGLSWAQDTLITLGGVEASGALAHQKRLNMMKTRRMDFRDSSFYLGAALDLPIYAWRSNTTPNGDIALYLKELSILDATSAQEAQQNFDNNDVIAASLQNLKGWVAVNLADPFLYFNLFALYQYVVRGESIALPTIPFGQNVNYLPSFRYELSPFGPEYYFHNYFNIFNYNAHASLRYGQYGNRHYYGLRLAGDILNIKRANVWLQIDIWNQPQYNIDSQGGYGNLPAYGDMQFGAYALVYASYRFIDALSIDAQVGYKSPGYVIGEDIGNRLIWRVGGSVYF